MHRFIFKNKTLNIIFEEENSTLKSINFYILGEGIFEGGNGDIKPNVTLGKYLFHKLIQ